MEIEKICVYNFGWLFADGEMYTRISSFGNDNQFYCYKNDKIVRIINGDFVVFIDFKDTKNSGNLLND